MHQPNTSDLMSILLEMWVKTIMFNHLESRQVRKDYNAHLELRRAENNLQKLHK